MPRKDSVCRLDSSEKVTRPAVPCKRPSLASCMPLTVYFVVSILYFQTLEDDDTGGYVYVPPLPSTVHLRRMFCVGVFQTDIERQGSVFCRNLLNSFHHTSRTRFVAFMTTERMERPRSPSEPPSLSPITHLARTSLFVGCCFCFTGGGSTPVHRVRVFVCPQQVITPILRSRVSWHVGR